MSQAFIREQDGQWLHDIAPTLQALRFYLTKENNGIGVYDKKVYEDKNTGNTVYEMSNGLSYSVDENNKWVMLDD